MPREQWPGLRANTSPGLPRSTSESHRKPKFRPNQQKLRLNSKPSDSRSKAINQTARLELGAISTNSSCNVAPSPINIRRTTHRPSILSLYVRYFLWITPGAIPRRQGELVDYLPTQRLYEIVVFRNVIPLFCDGRLNLRMPY